MYAPAFEENAEVIGLPISYVSVGEVPPNLPGNAVKAAS
jgi:hypothetical protein